VDEDDGNMQLQDKMDIYGLFIRSHLSNKGHHDPLLNLISIALDPEYLMFASPSSFETADALKERQALAIHDYKVYDELREIVKQIHDEQVRESLQQMFQGGGFGNNQNELDDEMMYEMMMGHGLQSEHQDAYEEDEYDFEGPNPLLELMGRVAFGQHPNGDQSSSDDLYDYEDEDDEQAAMFLPSAHGNILEQNRRPQKRPKTPKKVYELKKKEGREGNEESDWEDVEEVEDD
jgi:hypothetical protein